MGALGDDIAGSGRRGGGRLTILLLIAGAVIAVLGSRAAGIAFVGAAVMGGTTTLPAAATWTAGLAAGLTALGASPRRLAIPVLGATAVLAAGSARNTGVILALWVLGTAAAALGRGAGARATRWAVTLCVTDLLVIAAVGWTAIGVGYEGWPGRIDLVAGCLLIAAAVVRAPLASGPDDASQELGLLIVRTQCIVLFATVLPVSGVEGLFVAVAVLGAVGFAAAGLFRRAATRDVVQEISLLALVVASARAGWGPEGWEWGVLLAGTLIHNLRLRVSEEATSPLAAVLLRGGGLGLPLLPVVLVALEGALRAPSGAGLAIVAGMLAGLGARATADRTDEPARTGRAIGLRGVPELLIGGCLLAGLWAPVMSAPRPPAGGEIPWPAFWAGVVVVLAAAGGALVGRDIHPAPRREPGMQALPDPGVPGRWAIDRVLAAWLIALGAAAAALWVLGVLRGFL